jgi:hypothetical protein
MRRLALTTFLAVSLCVVVAAGDAYAKPAAAKTPQSLAEVRALGLQVAHLKAEAGQLRADLAEVRKELEALRSGQPAQLSSPIQNAPVAPLPEPTAGGLTPTRILTPNPQNYWLRLRQPQTGNTWSFASEPSSGVLRLGSDSAPTQNQLRISGDGSMAVGPLALNATGVAGPGQVYTSSDLTLHCSVWNPLTNAPADVTSTIRLGAPHGDDYYGSTLTFLDHNGYPWFWLLDHEGPGGVPGHQYFFESDEPGPMLLSLKNHAPGENVFIRFYAGDVAPGQFGQWHLGVGAGTPNGDGTWEPGDFQLIRDWYWNPLQVAHDDGRILVGQLPAAAGGRQRAEARLHVQGLVDETQLLVDANSSQAGDVLRVRDSAGTNYLAVTNAGDTAVGASSQPRAIVLYDIADGSAHYLRVNNGQLELVTP